MAAVDGAHQTVIPVLAMEEADVDARAKAQTLSHEFAGSFHTFLVTYHPVTLEGGRGRQQVRTLLRAIADANLKAIVTAANADAEGRAINAEVAAASAREPRRFRLVANLGQRRYFSCLAALDLLVGNSSSGLVEAPSFRVPVVNVGARQQGRVRAANVIDSGNDRRAIVAAIGQALSPSFRRTLATVVNPYDPHGDGRASTRIAEHLARVPLSPEVLKKRFVDLPVKESA
jgi:UDP-N-acetylglucosamine 2-epimerase (non-hydrolysing)/GDP/UDP-N,N'-diacetylbacillosamine 2-epimerase (hydrolysing)